MLESLVHERASFVTLTYADENLPEGGTVIPRHLQLFMKRVRKHAGRGIRFFGVGEYGDLTQRPHYHLALFGLGRSEADVIGRSWNLGFSYVGDLTLDSAQYIAGYVTKKMTGKDDARLEGRHPEFARMSLRPGIGALAARDVASALQNRHGWDEIGRLGDVPNVLKHGRKSLPLGRYMRTKLRAEMNFEVLNEPEEAAIKRSAEMLDVYRTYLTDEEASSPFTWHLGKKRKDAEDDQKAHQMEKKLKLYNSKKGIGI